MGSWKKRGRRALWILLAAVLLSCLAVGGFELWRWAIVPAEAPVIGVSLDTTWHSRLGITTKTYETALARAGAHLLTIRPGVELFDSLS